MKKDWFPLLVLILPVLLAVGRSIRVVRGDERLAVTRLGAFHRVAGPGVVILLPWSEKGQIVDMESIGPGGSWRALSSQDIESRVRASAGGLGGL